MPTTMPTTKPTTDGHFDTSYVTLPPLFFSMTQPCAVRAPRMVVFNHLLYAQLGLNFGDNAMIAEILAGNGLPLGATPLAQAYAGHQFGQFAQLGDGRAILLGEWVSAQGERWDIQLKGAGKTPYSWRGDGRAALGPMLREYLVSEAMYALGIPTTRSLAVVATGETVQRETALAGAVLTRIATSHLRVGTFEYATHWGGESASRSLLTYTLKRHFDESISWAENPALALLQAVCARQAALVVNWMRVGFIHGVMNTDNVAISGETLDYGPCAFMDSYHPDTVFSAIDTHGRYAFAQQADIMVWNMTRFAESLLHLIHPQPPQAIALAQEVLSVFVHTFNTLWLDMMRAKLGLVHAQADDAQWISELLTLMQSHQADYTNTFCALMYEYAATVSTAANKRGHKTQGRHKTQDRRLASLGLSDGEQFAQQYLSHAYWHDARFIHWRMRWLARLNTDSHEASWRLMQENNPQVIARNHRLNAALEAAEQGDLSLFNTLLALVKQPYQIPHDTTYQAPPLPHEVVQHTFCGT